MCVDCRVAESSTLCSLPKASPSSAPNRYLLQINQ